MTINAILWHVPTAALWLLLGTYLFFGAYVITVQLTALHYRKELPWAGYVLGAPFVGLGVALDVLFQYTVFALLYMEWPPRGEIYVTKRLRRWKHMAPYSRRGTWATKLCKFLSLFDPSGSHC
jgi:hypothetical protein